MIIRSIQRDLCYKNSENASNKNLTIKYNGSNSELSPTQTKLNEKLKLESSLIATKLLKLNQTNNLSSNSNCKLNSVNSNNKNVINGSNKDISTSTSKNEVSILLVITDDNNSNNSSGGSGSDKNTKNVGKRPSINNSLLIDENRIGLDKEKEREKEKQQHAIKRKKSKIHSKQQKYSKKSSSSSKSTSNVYNYDRNLDRFNYFNLLCSKKSILNNPDEYKLKFDGDIDLKVKPYSEDNHNNHHHSRKRKKNKKYSKHRRSSSSSSAHCCNRRPKSNIDRFNYFNLLCSSRKKYFVDEEQNKKEIGEKLEKDEKEKEKEEEKSKLIINKSKLLNRNSRTSQKKSKYFSNLAIDILCTDEEETNPIDCFYYNENNKKSNDSIKKPARLNHRQNKKDILDFVYGNSSSKMPDVFSTHLLDDEHILKSNNSYKKVYNKYRDIIEMFSDSDSELEFSIRSNNIANNILNYNPYVLTNINFDDTISDKFLADLQLFNIYGPIRLIPSNYQRPPLPPIYNSKFWLRFPPIYQADTDLLAHDKLRFNQLQPSVSGVTNYLYGEHINKSYSSSPSFSLSSFSDSTNLDLNSNENNVPHKSNLKLSNTKINSSNDQVESPYSTFSAIKNDKLFINRNGKFFNEDEEEEDEDEEDYISPIPIKSISAFRNESKDEVDFNYLSNVNKSSNSMYNIDEKNNIYKEIYGTNDDSGSNFYSDDKLFKMNNEFDKNEKTYESISDIYYEQQRLDEENDQDEALFEKAETEQVANDLDDLESIFQKITRQNRIIFYETNGNNEEELVKYEANLPCLPEIQPFPDNNNNSIVKITKLPANSVKRGIGSILKNLNQTSLINLSVIAEEETQSPRSSKLFSSSSSSNGNKIKINDNTMEVLDPEIHNDKMKKEKIDNISIILSEPIKNENITNNVSNKYCKKVRNRKLNISNSTPSSSSSSDESLDKLLNYRKSRNMTKSSSNSKSLKSNKANKDMINNDTYDDVTSSDDEVVYI